MGKLQRLKYALQKGKTLEEFKQILAEDGKLDSYDFNLLLRWAVMYQVEQFSKYYQILINKGANINFVDKKDFRTNLMIACELKKEEIVQVIASDQNTNFLLEDSTNKTALFYAINNKAKAAGDKYVKILLKKCPKLLQSHNLSKKNNPLELAISKSRVQIVKSFLQEGANPNQKIDQNGNTLLHEAVRLMNNQKQRFHIQQIVQFLLEKGGDPYKTNNQGKNAYSFADKCEREFEEMCTKAKNKLSPILVINSAKQREKVFTDAEVVYKKYQNLIQIPKKSNDDNSKGFSDIPFENQNSFFESLTVEITENQQKCLKDYKKAQESLAQFINFLHPLADKMYFRIEIYGSYSTGLWIKESDIDIMLIPFSEMLESSLWYLQEIQSKLRNTKYQKSTLIRTTKIPKLRIQQMSNRTREFQFQISINNSINNGKNHINYITGFLNHYLQIKPLFLIIKKLAHSYKINYPQKNGIKSFAIFLMLTLFIQQMPQQSNLGILLLKFLQYYGYQCTYEIIDNDPQKMVLNLPDPTNISNNIGQGTDVFNLQKMFKTGYIILHTSEIDKNRLEYLYQSAKIFM